MKTQILTLTVLLAGLTVVQTPDALAQYNGPSANALSTVSEVLTTGQDDQYVRLVGTLKDQVSEEKYTFADATGEIRVEIDRDEFKTPIDQATKVEIRGEIEKDFMESPEIDVDAIIVQ